jgi:hypothetical protein
MIHRPSVAALLLAACIHAAADAAHAAAQASRPDSVPAATAARAPLPPVPDARSPYRVQRLSGPVQVDGRSDEPAWQDIAPLPAVSSFPELGAEPSERTEFRIAYDDEFLYVAGRLYDRDVSGIRATSLRRDDGSFTNDWFVINLDTFLDRETMLVLGVSPAGVRTDVVFSNDGTTSNFNWNAFWDARAVVADDGWHAEIRIPLSTLRFEERDGSVLMGVTIWRRIARRNEAITWPAIDHEWGTNSIFKASQAAVLELTGVRRHNPVYVTPYVLGGGSRTHALDPAGTAWEPATSWTREAGLDVKYSPTSNLTLDVTANTDFAQVEADDQQVNLTRFSLFFPERRLFFQERASVFEYALGGSDQLFYSRRIGLEAGAPVRIYGGGRAVGRVGSWDVAVLDMHTATAVPGTSRNDGVARVRRRVLNENSYAGGMFTSRIDTDGARHFTTGADALLRVRGQDYLTLALATTASTTDSLAAADRVFARVRLDRRGNYGFLYGAEAAFVGAEFLPALGFLARNDHTRASARIGYGFRMPPSSRLQRQALGMEAFAIRRNADREIESALLGAEWGVEAQSGRAFAVGAAIRHEDLLSPFRLADDVVVPAGTYDFVSSRISYTPAAAALLRVVASAEAGQFYDGRSVSASLSPTWIPNRHLQLSGTWQVNRLDFSGRDERLTAHITRLRAQVMASSTLSGVAFAQFNSVADAVILNARVRWNPREGNDLYLVLNEDMNTSRYDHSPARPLTDSRTLLLKYSHTTRF